MKQAKKNLTGRIYQSLSGFYSVWTSEGDWVAKPKGLFRHHKQKPMVGDWVELEVDPEDRASEGRIMEILPRKNALLRPPVANVDTAMVVMSLVEPDFSYNLLDTYLVAVDTYDIQAWLILSKYDLLVQQEGSQGAQAFVEEIKAIYQGIGYPVSVLGGQPGQYQQLAQDINQGVYVVMGQSGAGKSTLLNGLLPDSQIETAEISSALNRGRHTTREVTLYPFREAFLADTPGFSSLSLDHIPREDLAQYYPEVDSRSHQCKFRSCLHLQEPGCAVKEAVEEGDISQQRYQHYVGVMTHLDQVKPQY